MKTKNDIMSNKKDIWNGNSLLSSIKKLLQITVFSVALIVISSTAFACEGEDLSRMNALDNELRQLIVNINLRGVELDPDLFKKKVLKLYSGVKFSSPSTAASCDQVLTMKVKQAFESLPCEGGVLKKTKLLIKASEKVKENSTALGFGLAAPHPEINIFQVIGKVNQAYLEISRDCRGIYDRWLQKNKGFIEPKKSPEEKKLDPFFR